MRVIQKVRARRPRREHDRRHGVREFEAASRRGRRDDNINRGVAAAGVREEEGKRKKRKEERKKEVARAREERNFSEKESFQTRAPIRARPVIPCAARVLRARERVRATGVCV